MFDSNQFFGVSAAGAGFYPKTIDQSLRFEDGDSAYLTFDPAADGDRDNWSLSFWFKRANLGLTQLLFGQGTNGSNNRDIVYIAADDTLEVASYGGSYTFRYVTTQKFRDPSAWYHLVISYQSGDATASDRLRIYLNGERITAFSTSTDPSLNADSAHFNSGSPQYFGRYIDQASSYLDGYLAEVHFTDGTSYTADAFGELKSGIWVAKSPSVTYGTNGFKLTFEDSAAIGDDTSGNANDWTVNNLVASDVVPDSPTNNFAVLNPLTSTTSASFKEGNLYIDIGNTPYGLTYSTIGIDSGKWYFEILWIAGVPTVGLNAGNSDDDVLAETDGIRYNSSNGNVLIDNVSQGTFTAWDSSGVVVGVAINADDDEVSFYRNNTLITTQSFTFDKTYFPAVSDTSTSNPGDAILNFGQDSTFAGNLTAGGNSDANGIGDFKYAPPSGFLALCTANLPDPAIDPAQDATPEDYFNVVTYSGNSSSLSVTGVGFEPDFTWIKNRTSASDYHTFFDKVRGTNGSYYSFLLCPYTGTEDYAPQGGNGGFGAIETFDTDGFTLDSSNSDWSRTNESGQDYVAFNWSLPTTVSGSTAGVGTSQSYTGRANADAGVSIIAYSGNNSGGHRIPHHLNEAPEFVICKGRTFLQGWPAYHAYQDITNPEDIYLELNTTNYRNQDNALFWNDTKPDSTHVTLGSIAWLNGSGYDYVMYSFHSVDGFSKVGQYTGNGSATDGTFVYTGFRPKWVMIKQVSSAGWGWYIFDSERSQDNVVDDYINAASVAGEVSNSTTADIDFLSNGFKLRGSFQGTNENLMDFSYLAFAEQPAKYSNAR